MNRLIRLIKENVIPSIVFAIFAVSCGCAWYFLHPASPYHPRYSFVVYYQAIGTLSPGNTVEVRGIKAGEIKKVELTEDGVYVSAWVYASTKIPINSEFRLINSGLMGEREMCILTGDSQQLISDGDTLKGVYDEGTSGIFKNLEVAFEDLKEISDTLKALKDSVTVGSTGKQISRIVEKGKGIVRTTQKDVKSWVEGVEQLFSDLDKSLTQVKGVLSGVVDQGGAKVEEAEGLMSRTEALLVQVREQSAKAKGLLEPLSRQDNTAGLILSGEGPLKKESERILRDVEKLLQDIRKSSLKLNVDIF